MILYIIKSILICSVLLVVYYLLLEKERMYQFNRYYLLFSYVAIYILPAVRINFNISKSPYLESIVQPISSIQSVSYIEIQENIANNNNLSSILLITYLIISVILLCRFTINMSRLIKLAKANPIISNYDASIVLLKEKVVPFNFLNYVFVNGEDFKKEKIDKRILAHEFTHVRQKHSIDIILVELLFAFAWINPLVLLLKRSIRLNHEFISDNYVINKYKDPNSYQNLVLNNIHLANSTLLSSPFNYLSNKKRIIMMTKTTNPLSIRWKKLILLPLATALCLLFTLNFTAQSQSPSSGNQTINIQEIISAESKKTILEYVQKNIKYPKEAAMAKQTGTAFVKLEVENGFTRVDVFKEKEDLNVPILGNVVVTALKPDEASDSADKMNLLLSEARSCCSKLGRLEIPEYNEKAIKLGIIIEFLLQ